MDLLTVDLGNSRLKWALWKGAQIATGGAVEYRKHAPDQPWQHCWGELAAPQRLVVVSVAPPETDSTLSGWCSANWGIEPEFLRSSAQAGGVVNAYHDPSRLGVDRWVALIAAHRSFPGRAVCVADCGTAVTVDRLDSSGRHLGGVILPGLKLMQESLYSATAGITARDPSGLEQNSLGRDTASGTALGCSYAVAGAMERVAGDPAEGAQEVVCLVTGGAAQRLLPCLTGRWQLRPELVLEGARILADEHSPGASQ